MSKQTKTIGLIALIFLFIAALVGGSILMFAVSRVRMAGFMNDRQTVFERRDFEDSPGRDFGRLTPPEGDDTVGPRRSFEGRSFNHGRGGFDHHMVPGGRVITRGGGFLAGLRDLSIIALVILIFARFSNIRQWFTSRTQKRDDDSAAAPAPAAAAPSEADEAAQKGDKGVDPDPSA